MSVLVAKQISCEKQDRTLFQDIDLSVKSGELVLLKGENGAGKTSLLRILVGLSVPVSGSVHINNLDVHQDVNTALASTLYIGHKLGLNGLLTPLENLEFWCQLNAVSASTQSITATLEKLGLIGLEDISVKNLSAGQQRRVALAKLWLQDNAQLWVLDEPFTALDVQVVSLLEEHIGKFLEKGGAVLMTSHQTVSISNTMRIFELEYSW